MAISFPLALPTHKNPRSIDITMRKVVGVNTAPASLVAQTYEWPGERWEAQIVLAPAMARDDGDPWVAWLTSLRGPVGSFLLGSLAGATPRGAAAGNPGTPQVDGDQAAQLRTLAIKTGLGTTANYLRAGDWLQLGTGSTSRLHKVLQDASLDSSGKVTLDIWPALRSAVGNSAPIVLSGAKGKFMLATSSPSYAENSALMIEVGAIPCVEDLRP